MSSFQNQNWSKLLVTFVAIAIVSLGVFFRFANLDQKVFWIDEVATAVRVSGYSIPEVVEDLQQQDLVTRSDLLAYQQLTPQRNLGHTWQALTSSPEHAPLYFLLTRLWLDFWGDSITTMRSLSAYLSLLIFPSLYWLLTELFARPLVSWLGVVLISVSPFYAAYAQEARPYSLWTVAILLMGASLLRAIRLGRSQDWVWYGLSLILGLYTSLLSVFVAAFQGFYLLLLPNRRKLLKPYFLTSAIALLCFSPWLWVIFSKLQTLQDNTSWLRTSMDLVVMFATWIGTVLLIFGDLPLSPEADLVQVVIAIVATLLFSILLCGLVSRWQSWRNAVSRVLKYLLATGLTLVLVVGLHLIKQLDLDLVTLIGALIAVIILGFAGYALFFLVKNSQRSQSLFVISLLLSLPVPLLVNDLVFGGQSSSSPRYLIPYQLGILIAAAYTLGYYFPQHWQDLKQAKVWTLITMFFIGLGIFSCQRNLQISPIYLKSRNVDNPAIAKIINQQSQPLVLFEPISAFDTLSLSHLLRSQVKFKLIENYLEIKEHLDSFEPIYIVSPSPTFKTELAQDQQLNLQPVFQAKLITPGQFTLELWKVEQQ